METTWYPALLRWQWVDLCARDVITVVFVLLAANVQEIAKVFPGLAAIFLGRWRVDKRLLWDEDLVDVVRFVVVAFCRLKHIIEIFDDTKFYRLSSDNESVTNNNSEPHKLWDNTVTVLYGSVWCSAYSIKKLLYSVD